MSIRSSPFPKSPWLLLLLGLFLADSSVSHGQVGHLTLRGAPGIVAPTGFPGAMPMSLVNNGSLMVSVNPNVGIPNNAPFAYIATLPLGDRLPYNGIFADPQMTVQTLFGQTFNQNLLQLMQQRFFGNPLGPVGNLLALGLVNQPFAPGNGPPPVKGARGGRRNYGPYATPLATLGFPGQGMGYNPYMGMGQGLGCNPYMGMGQGMMYDPSMAQGSMFSMGMMTMAGMMNNMYMATPGYNLDPSQNNGLFAQPNTQPGNLPNANVDMNGFGKGFAGFGGF